MLERSFRPLLYALALTGLLADQASKYGVFAQLAERPDWSFIVFHVSGKGGFALHPAAAEDPATRQLILDEQGRPKPHVNHGALFGFLQGYETAANLLFAAVSLAAALGILWWSRYRSVARDWLLCAALGLILGGTLGNLYDRLVFNGVRDFLHWDYLYNWPVFNVADCCLVCGASLMLLQAFFGKPAAVESAPQADAAAAPFNAVAASEQVTTASKA